MKLKIDSASFYEALCEVDLNEELVKTLKNWREEGDEWKNTGEGLIRLPLKKFKIGGGNGLLPNPYEKYSFHLLNNNQDISAIFIFYFRPSFFDKRMRDLDDSIGKAFSDKSKGLFLRTNSYGLSGYILSKDNVPVLAIQKGDTDSFFYISMGDNGTKPVIFDDDFLSFDLKLKFLESHVNNFLQVGYQEAHKSGIINGLPIDVILNVRYNGVREKL